MTINLNNLLIFWEFVIEAKGGNKIKKLILGIIVTICCLNAVAKNNEVIKSSSRQVIADKIDENLEKTFSQSNIISSEALKEFKKSSINKEKENNDITSEDTLVPSK